MLYFFIKYNLKIITTTCAINKYNLKLLFTLNRY